VAAVCGDDLELHRLAAHESGHVVVASVLGWAAGPVTVTSAGNGCYVPVPPQVTAEPFDADSLPFVAWPAAVRSYVESDTMIALAGDLAVRMFASVPAAAVDTAAAEREAASLPPAGEQVRTWAAGVAADGTRVSDEELVRTRVRWAFGGDVEGGAAWLRWADIATERLLAVNAQRVRRFAAVLATVGVLSAEATAGLLAGRPVLAVAR
jgi:hypothetical protein